MLTEMPARPGVDTHVAILAVFLLKVASPVVKLHALGSFMSEERPPASNGLYHLGRGLWSENRPAPGSLRLSSLALLNDIKVIRECLTEGAGDPRGRRR